MTYSQDQIFDQGVDFPDPIYFRGMYQLLNTQDTWQEFVNDWQVQPLDYPQKDLDRYKPFLHNYRAINGSRILDLGCNLGYSLIFASHLGASDVTGIEIRQHWIDAGLRVLDHYPKKNIKLLQQDVNDLSKLRDLVEEHNMVVCMGLFYHLSNHVQFLETLCRSSTLHTIMIESLLKQNPNYDDLPSIHFDVEPVDDPLNAYSELDQYAFVGAPNIKWFEKIFAIHGWKIVALHVTQHPDWRPKRFCITAEKIHDQV